MLGRAPNTNLLGGPGLWLQATVACVLSVVILLTRSPALVAALGTVLLLAILHRPWRAMPVFFLWIGLLGSTSLLKLDVGIQLVELDAVMLPAGLWAVITRPTAVRRRTRSRVGLMVGLLVLVVAVSATIGLLHGNDPQLVRNEARPFLYLLVMYLLTSFSLGSLDRLHGLTKIWIVVSLIVAIRTLLVSALTPMPVPGTEEAVVYATRVLNSGGFKRVLPEGSELYTSQALLLIWAGLMVGVQRLTAPTCAALTVLLAAIAVSYTRSYWFPTVLILAAITLVEWWKMSPRRRSSFLLRLGFGGLVLAGLAVWLCIVRAEVLDGLSFPLTRANVLSAYRAGDPNIWTRLAEVEALWALFKEKPVLGHGLGAKYAVFAAFAGETVEWNYTHNAYLYFLFKTGAIGFTVLLVLLLVYALEMRKAYIVAPSPADRFLALGFLSSTMVLLASSLTAPWLIHYVGAAYFGFALAVAAFFERRSKRVAKPQLTPQLQGLYLRHSYRVWSSMWSWRDVGR